MGLPPVRTQRLPARAIQASGDIDVLRSGMQLVVQELIELEAVQAVGAPRYERSAGLERVRTRVRRR